MLSEEIKGKLYQYLIKKTDFLQSKDRLNEDQLGAFVDKAVKDFCDEEHVEISTEARLAFIRNLISSVVSMGPLRPLMEDKDVTEIMVNGSDQVFVQRFGKIEKTDIIFRDRHHLAHTIQKLLAASGSNRRVDESMPYADFSLADGSRVNVILPPCSMIGPVMTIRRFSSYLNTLDDLIERGMLNKKMAVLLVAAMKAKLNVVFCGATGTGKTTTLNVLSRHIPEDERIVTIEDTQELRLLQDHVVSLQSKAANIEGRGAISIGDLFVNSLRMRPDRIIIGEVRGGEMWEVIQAITTGHSGSLVIAHADSPEDCFNRMITMMLMAGFRMDTREIQKQVARVIDLIVHIELYTDGVRRLSNITDIRQDPKGGVQLNDIFRFEQKALGKDGKIEGEWIMDRHRPSFYEKFAKRHVQLPEGFFS